MPILYELLAEFSGASVITPDVTIESLRLDSLACKEIEFEAEQEGIKLPANWWKYGSVGSLEAACRGN